MLEKLINDLIAYIDNHELTHKDAAIMLGISRGHMTHIIRKERNPSAKLIKKIEEVIY